MNINTTSIAAGNEADKDADEVPATTTTDTVARSIAADVASGIALAAIAATNLFVDSKINPRRSTSQLIMLPLLLRLLQLLAKKMKTLLSLLL